MLNVASRENSIPGSTLVHSRVALQASLLHESLPTRPRASSTHRRPGQVRAPRTQSSHTQSTCFRRPGSRTNGRPPLHQQARGRPSLQPMGRLRGKGPDLLRGRVLKRPLSQLRRKLAVFARMFVIIRSHLRGDSHGNSRHLARPAPLLSSPLTVTCVRATSPRSPGQLPFPLL